MSATTNLGKVSVTPKGAWAITNAYEILDIVTSGGSSYLAKQDVPAGVPLSNTSYWIMIAEKGDGGEVTSASASISGGYGTPGVTVTAGGTAHERTLAFAFTNLRGEKGETGNGIDSVYKTGTSGLVDTYTILFTDGSTYEFEVNNGTASIDDTLTKSGWAADAKAVGDTKASIDGFYETMGVGVADNLTPYSEDSGASQDIPFIAQGTGCGNGESVVDTGSYCQLKKKLGNTVCVNQLAQVSDFAYSGTRVGVTVTSNSSTGEVTTSGTAAGYPFYPVAQNISRFVVGHKYLQYYKVTNPSGINLAFRVITSDRSEYHEGSYIIFTAGSATYNIEATGDKSSGIYDGGKLRDYQVIDLTLWFGSNDRIPSDLLSHPENWGRYYAGSLANNAGTLESADGTVLGSIGRNLWDEVAEAGKISTTTGENVSGNTEIRSKNYIPVIPNTTYCPYIGSAAWMAVEAYDADKNFVKNLGGINSTATFTTPSNCYYIRFYTVNTYGTTYKNDITISLYYSGESGYDQYYPYSVLAEVDTGSEVLRSAGAVADEKTPDGTITRKVGVVDLGTLTWNMGSGTVVQEWYILNAAFPGIKAATPNLQSTKFITQATNGEGTMATSGVAVRFYTDAYATTDAIRTAMSGVYLYYELATPTTEQGTAFAENIPCDDFGSMYWTQTKGIPQGNEIFYPVDYKASIDTLYNRVEGDMSAIVIDGQLEVVADRIPEAPSEDGTYTLKATVSSGTKTYSWVADE